MEPIFRESSIADVFEQVLVPAVFRPYAQALVERARPIGPADRVLDLGCGTGIVARVVRERLGGGARVTGVDVSPPMIAKARALEPELAWHEGNATALPFADRSFELVLSQQMLQFVPDRVAALREVRRVLVPGGRLIASTWRPRRYQPLYEALGQTAERHLGPANDKRWSLDGDALRALLLEAGFTDVTVETCSLAERYRSFPVRASATAAHPALAQLSDAEREARLAAVEADSAGVLAGFADDGACVHTSITNVAIATAPRSGS